MQKSQIRSFRILHTQLCSFLNGVSSHVVLTLNIAEFKLLEVQITLRDFTKMWLYVKKYLYVHINWTEKCSVFERSRLYEYQHGQDRPQLFCRLPKKAERKILRGQSVQSVNARNEQLHKIQTMFSTGMKCSSWGRVCTWNTDIFHWQEALSDQQVRSKLTEQSL